MPNLVTGFNKALITLGMKLSLYSYFNLMSLLPVNVLEKHNYNAKYNPLYYVVEETENNNLWIVTRGSFSIADWLTDFDFAQVDVTLDGFEYHFHRGFYQAALNVFSNVEHYIKDHDGPIYFTGHSYGGSVTTALLAIAKAKYKNKDINALAFAPAPTMGSDIPDDVYNKLATIVNKNDIVPTLSIGNAYRTFKNIISGFENAEQIIEEKIIEFAELIKNLNLDFAIEFAEALEYEAPTIAHTIVNYNFSVGDVEYVSGNVYHFYRSNPRLISETIEDPSVTINDLSISLDAVLHHEGNMYLMAINKQIDG